MILLRCDEVAAIVMNPKVHLHDVVVAEVAAVVVMMADVPTNCDGAVMGVLEVDGFRLHRYLQSRKSGREPHLKYTHYLISA